MKKIILIFIFFLCAKSFAQTNGITYQALILNPTEGKVSTATNTNSPLVSKDICMLFKFVDEFSNIEYQEVIRTKTDPYGMVNLIIGTGTQTAGYSTSFDKISWDSVEKNLVVGISFSGDCSSFTEISNQPFSSVPFAYSSINAVNVTGVVALENGGTNATTVLGAKTNLGLENVDNTTDLNKPISTASKLALNLKEDTINKSTNVTTDGNSDIKYPTVKSVKNYVDSSVSFNLSGLTNEISRATTAENTIAANLVLETERATLAEATLTTNLTAEVNRATAAEATKEDAANKSIDGSFTSNSDVKFPTEKATKTYVDASASSSSLALTNEISRATLAENAIAANLVMETERATLAETSNETAITAETNRATLAEATLTTNLTAEVNRATTAEATKEDAANKSADGTFTSNSDVKFPTEKATKTYVDATASSNSLALTNEISRATLAENTIAANLVSENERATLAEATNATAITAETNRATLAETTLSTNLNAEVIRATATEATKEDTVNKSIDGSFASNSDVKFPTEKATKTYVDASASSNSLALNNEISRATLAENTIAANLVSENERATLAEATNATSLTAETNRATLAEATLTTNLTAEVNRATTAEATKEDAVNKSTDGSFVANSDVKFPTEKATKTYVDASASSNSLALTNEISRATTAENTIAANLVSENERATLAEATNATAITAETNRSTLAENTIAANLVSETERATLAEATLTTNLTAETNRAITAEATKEDAVNKSIDGSFASNSDVKFPTEKATKTYVDASASSNSLALTNEISRATLAENAIAANLVLETERATLAEATNANEITAETNRATLAESTLLTNLYAEVNRATAAEATKEDAANKSTDGSFDSNSDVKFPTEKATKTYVDATASSNSLVLNNEISRATLAENTIAANLVSETNRATLAESTNATAINAETNRASLAEATLTTNLTAEVNRATAAEATKEDAANKSIDGSFTSNSDVKFPTEKATKTYVDATASSSSLALTNEISRATLAENAIAENLVSENERATLAEATNATAITAETNRANLAENTLTANLTAETTRAILAEATNATAITAETTRATLAEATKEDAVNKSTDGSFASNSDVKFPTEKATKTYVDASASSNSVALTNEISRATLAENIIAANLVSENERATLAEATNATAITAETNRANLAENTLTANLTAETTRAILAEATNATAITAETTRATLAEATKEDAVNKSTDGSFASNSDVKFPTEKATKTYVDATASSSSLALTNEISRATLAENTIASNLLSENERATLAETNNATAITAETTRATLAEATKEDAANKSIDGSFTSNSDVKFPTEKATKTYVDASASSSSLALTNEISRATLAENTIAANLVSENERATLAEATNATEITAEVNRATAAEATKEDASNKSTDGSFTSNSDVKFPTEKATKTYVDASASSNSLALNNEISRATLAETNNATAITAETTRATLAEATLTTNLTAEVNRATTAEATKEDTANKSTDGSFTSNSDVKFPTEKATKTYVDATASSSSLALTNEISRATLAENTIAANLVSENERATLAETTNTTAITAEITRATLAEATNATALTAETNRATLAETTLTTNLNAEVNRATAAEATKEDAANKSTDGSFASNSDVKFPTEKATKTYVDATASFSSLALTNEISRATIAENAIAANLVTETERATLAEATKEDAANKSTDGSFTSNSDVKFPTEKATKAYVDASASSNSLALTNEISRATTAENNIAANLVSETERATLAETTNSTAITAETNRATLAETTNSTAITTEINRATAAEATKEDAANKSTDGTFTSNSDVKFPTEKATKTYVDATASSSSLALTNEISRATLVENTIAANLVLETERATLAETNNATAITSETNRASLEEATLTTNLTAEVNRATAAEATKEDAANKSIDGSFTSNSDVKFPTEKATKTYVDASASSNSFALTNEISRATLAENTIAANLVSENERATLAEATNATALTAETNRATLAETTLTTNLNSEVNRATVAEATKEDAANKSTDGSFTSNSDVKFPTEKAAKTYIDASASSNSLALTNEISRATLAENTIAANLVLETERATLVEATLTTNLTVEVNRATLAETTLSTNLNAETNRANLAETTLTTNLTAELNRATAAEATKEDAANKSTDGSFTSNSDVKFPSEKATKSYVDASASSNSLALSNEISRATLAENAIAANLVTETERATLAEATNATAINAEANRATLAEATNATALTAETNRATLAETTLTTNLNAEVNRATAAEATKEDAVNKSIDGSFASNSDVKFPTEKATKTYVDASASSNSLALTNEISRATLSENTIATNLLSETERATLAENTLATNLDLKANLASPNFTGTPSLPTGTIAVTQSAENNSTALATTAFVTAANATNANLTGDVTSIGNLTTIATNVITTTKIADSNITNAKLDKANIPLSGFGVAASAVALGNNKLTEVADPTNPQDAATKNYVDALTSIGVTGNGTTNYIPKFSSSRALANSLIFDSGTQIGIGTNAPTSLFQIGGNGSGDNPLKYDYDGGGNGALKFGFRQYEYRIKSNQNSGVLENLTFSYYNQSTGVDSDRFVIANDGIYIPGKLNVTGTVNGGAATLSSLNVNNSQLNVNSSTNTVGFFTDSPTSKFQIGGDGNFDNPLKYDYGYGSGEGALKFGFRQNEFRIKTNQNSGVLEKLTFSYYKNADGTDIESMHIDNNGVVSITKLAVTAGSPGNGKVLTSDAFGNASWVAPVVASSNEFVDLTTTQTIAGAKTFSSTVTGNSFVKSGGTSAQYLMADGTVSTGAAPVREVADETSAAASQNSFTLTQTPSINSKVKMYVNGIRISNAAYSVSGTTLTYIPANNGSYILSVNDRVQFDYFY